MAVKYDNIRKIAAGQGDDYTTSCLLHYPYLKKTRSEQMANTKCLFKSDILNKFYSNSRMHWECNIVYYS